MQDPLSDITLLTTPYSDAYTTLFSHNSVATEPSDSHRQLLDHETERDVYHIPAFSIDSVTVGLCISQDNVKKRWPFIQPAPHMLHFSRYARFRNAIIYVSRRSPDIEIRSIVLRSAKRKTAVSLTIRETTFDYESFSVNTIFKSLSDLCKIEYCRSCPHCTETVTESCKCKINSMPQVHLLDFRSEAYNMSLHTGQYHGGANIEYFREGEQALHANLEATDCVQIEINPKLVQHLSDLAIRNRLSAYSLKPRKKTLSCLKSDIFDQVTQWAMTLASSDNPIDDCSSVSGDSCTGKDVNRRRKNRIAAARSNLKRKVRNKNLRLSLVILRQQIAELRAREDHLRCEQSWLRQRCMFQLTEEQQSLIPDLI